MTKCFHSSTQSFASSCYYESRQSWLSLVLLIYRFSQLKANLPLKLVFPSNSEFKTIANKSTIQFFRGNTDMFNRLSSGFFLVRSL